MGFLDEIFKNLTGMGLTPDQAAAVVQGGGGVPGGNDSALVKPQPAVPDWFTPASGNIAPSLANNPNLQASAAAPAAVPVPQPKPIAKPAVATDDDGEDTPSMKPAKAANTGYARGNAIYGALTELGVPNNVAAGAVGSLMGEGGRHLDPTSRNPGDGADGSDSIGFGQWNGARARALRDYAAKTGGDPLDFNTQVGFLKQELQTTHAPVLQALRTADNTVENGANIWTRKYEIPADPDATMAKRIANGKDFLANGLGQGGDVTGSVVAKSPVPGNGAGALSPASWGSNLWGQNPGSGKWDIGDALLGVAAAGSSIWSPAQGQVFSGLLQQSRSQAANSAANAGTWSNVGQKYKTQDGKTVLLQQNSKTGETRTIPVPAEDDTPDQANPKPKERELFQNNQNTINSFGHVVDTLNPIIDRLYSGDFKVSWDAKLGQWVATVAGKAGQSEEDRKNAEASVNQALLEFSKSVKGPQTGKVMEKELAAIMPMNGDLSPRTFADTLVRIRDKAQDQANTALQTNRSLADTYPGLTKGMTDSTGQVIEDYSGYHQKRQQSWGDAQKKQDEAKKGFIERQEAGNQPQKPQMPAAPAVGTIQKGYRFKGGNPADPNAWEKVQ